MTNAPPKKSSVQQKTLALTAEFAFIIILPLIALVPVGKWLSTRYASRLWLIIALVVAFLISTLWLMRKIQNIYEEFKNLK